MSPDLDLYVTPVQIDPEKPALPISHPFIYSVYLSKLNDRYGTLGLAEDTWALNEGVIDEDGIPRAGLPLLPGARDPAVHRPREDAAGSRVCVSSTPRTASSTCSSAVSIPRTPRTRARRRRSTAASSRTSTGGWTTWWAASWPGSTTRASSSSCRTTASRPSGAGVNINTWLLQNGYLALKDGQTTSGEWFADVDWSRTRAYCLGLTGIFINRKGREGQGIVDEGAELRLLKRELVTRLTGLVDAETGQLAIREVQDAAVMFSGPYLDNGPDLLLGFNAGYRISWECASGKVTASVFENNTKRWSGDHCVDPKLVPGIFFCNRPTNGHAPDIRDVAPTVLRLFGVDIPAYMEGKPLLDDPGRLSAPRRRRP